MVNFSRKLRQNVYVEWSAYYLDYKGLKKLLKGYAPSSPGRKKLDERSSLLAKQAGAQNEFTSKLRLEMTKVNTCYQERLHEYTLQVDLLQQQYNPEASDAEDSSLQGAFVEVYRLMTHLLNFALLNYTAIIKIVKKYDKLMTPNTISSEMHETLKEYEFSSPTRCTALTQIVEDFFARIWCENNSNVARASLLVKKEDEWHWDALLIGFRVGIILVLLIWVSWDAVIAPGLWLKGHRYIINLVDTLSFPVYRSIGCLVLLQWLWTSSLWVWRSARINYRYIFELDPKTNLSLSDVFQQATWNSIVYLINVILYFKTINGAFPVFYSPGIYPFSLMLYSIVQVFTPWKARKGLLVTILQVMISPLGHVTFLHTFVGDYLTSTVKITQDIVWSVCFFSSGEFLIEEHRHQMVTSSCTNAYWYTQIAVPVICVLPLWWRFQQNLRRIKDTQTWFPHVLNAFKYAMAQVVSLFGVFHPVYQVSERIDADQKWWIAFFTFSTIYTWVWDVKMDWGLGNPKFNYLADRCMFSHRSVYYVAIIADFFLRFFWMTTLIPPSSASVHGIISSYILPYIAPFTMVAELFRRTMWSYFRLENEHLRNTQGFRRVDFIPLHFDNGVGSKREPVQDNVYSQGKKRMVVLGVVAVTVCVVGLSILAIAVDNEHEEVQDVSSPN